MRIIHHWLLSTTIAAVMSAAAITILPGVSQAEPSAACAVGDLKASSLPRRIAAGGCVKPGRTIRGAKVAAVVPGPGHGVVANVLGLKHEETLTIDTAADGSVTVVTSTEPVATATATAAQDAPQACDDGAYTLLGHDYTRGGNFYWYYAPADDFRSGLSNADAEAALINGTRNITVGNNDCGFSGQPNVNHTYGGQTSVGPNITDRGTKCGAADGWSITGWGDVITDYLASTCTWTRNDNGHNVVTTSDMIANYNYVWWNGQGDCPNNGNSFDLESTTTHERGHTFGLGHAPDGHNNETMTGILRCDTRQRTLGLGDFTALISLYGYL